MLTLQELKDDPSLLLELKKDVREEAENLGDVTNVVLYDVSSNLSRLDVQLTYPPQETDGVMTAKFRDPISAQAGVLVRVSVPSLERRLFYMMNVRQKMNGRYFTGRKIEASLFDSEERFKKSGAGQTQEDGEEAGENERLADFEKWLMAEGGSN